MESISCKICGTSDLMPKWDSDYGVGWVHCDRCGNHSTPIDLFDGREKIIAQWNKENERTQPRVEA